MSLACRTVSRSRALGFTRKMTSQTNAPVRLYDIPSKAGSCWSPNVWKVRQVLNYKKIPYATSWVEYPDIKGKLKGLGIAPNPPGSWSDYSCPAVQLPNGENIMDSLNIVQRLETLWPRPSLHLDSDTHEKVLPALSEVIHAARPMIMATVCRNVLCERSAEWFTEDRQRRFGKTLDQYERDEGGDVAWNAAQKGLESLKQEMKQQKRDDGPFVLGSTVSYGDFLIAAIFNWLERVHPAVYGKFVGYDESFKNLHEACRPWLKRDD